MIQLTEAAAQEIKNLRKEANEPERPLRLAVRAGGCSGMEYGMGFDDAQPDDHTVEHLGINMVIDPESLHLLKGTTIHFDDSLHGKGFEILNPNAKNTCGCGKSFH